MNIITYTAENVKLFLVIFSSLFLHMFYIKNPTSLETRRIIFFVFRVSLLYCVLFFKVFLARENLGFIGVYATFLLNGFL